MLLAWTMNDDIIVFMHFLYHPESHAIRILAPQTCMVGSNENEYSMNVQTEPLQALINLKLETERHVSWSNFAFFQDTTHKHQRLLLSIFQIRQNRSKALIGSVCINHEGMMEIGETESKW